MNPWPRLRKPARTGASSGFTLIEAMITVAVLAIIAAIALPGYTDYLQRSKLIEAKVSLSDMRVRLEQYFLDARAYPNACVPPGPAPAPAGQIHLPIGARYFTVDCALTASTYRVTATGNAAQGMSGFAYTIDETDQHRTLSLPPGWTGAGSACWVSRKNGEC